MYQACKGINRKVNAIYICVTSGKAEFLVYPDMGGNTAEIKASAEVGQYSDVAQDCGACNAKKNAPNSGSRIAGLVRK